MPYPGNLATAQAGNGDSTNIIRRQGILQDRKPILRITTNAWHTITINIQGSYDGTNWFNVAYSPMNAAPAQFTFAAIVITTATTNLYYLPIPTGFNLKTVASLNTGMTPTTDLL
jgi:hypothetical protein